MARTNGKHDTREAGTCFGLPWDIQWRTIPTWRLLLGAGVAFLGLLIAMSFIAMSLQAFKKNQHGGYEMSRDGKVVSDDALGYEMMRGGASAPSRAPMPSVGMIGVPPSGYVPDDSAEETETHTYSAHFETTSLAAVCDALIALKPSRAIVFLNAERTEKTCRYHFKVMNSQVEETLAYLTALKPKELSQSTESAQRRLDDYLTRRVILENSAASLEEVLADALASYDALTVLATREGNADALARSIRAKVELIDQLRQRREHIRIELDALARAEAEMTDRLHYTEFFVSATEFAYLDPKRIGESWKYAVAQFFTDLNMYAQQLAFGLILFLLYGAMFAIYAFLLLLAAKFGWKFVVRVWKT